MFGILVALDQAIKILFLSQWEWYSKCISLILAFNEGVAFSMFSFLEHKLKYVQLCILVGVIIYLFFNKDVFRIYFYPIVILFAGALSNIADRFVHGAVVDYVYWHCIFDFAIFNLADVLINIAVGLILYISYKESKKTNTTSS